MIRRISICICLLCCAAALPAAAQSLGAFKRQLAEPAASSSLFGRARVIASEYGETAGKVADAARAEQRQRFAGYRGSSARTRHNVVTLPVVRRGTRTGSRSSSSHTGAPP